MSMAQRLSNHSSACRVISLAKAKLASEFPGRDKNGPYVIRQTGYEPGDTTMRAGDYLLGRSGAWLGMHWFIRLPVPERRKEFIFDTLGEAMEVLGELTSKVEVIREKPASASDEAPEDDEIKQAIEAQ
jgi:hypothetical protein